jgi:hypothetical protein
MAASGNKLLSFKPMHIDLLNHLAGISHKWRLIGESLFTDRAFIEGQKNNENADMVRLSNVLHKWRGNDEDVTWRKILDVLDGSVVNETETANRIRNFLDKQETYQKYTLNKK